jgi:hypothetical protein
MSELAFNLNGDPFEVPANAAGWRVRRMKQKGAPEVVYGRNGTPLVLPIEADLDDVRNEVGAPGRYRLDPVDESNRPINGASAGYVFVHAEQHAPAVTQSSRSEPSDNIIIEAMRMNAEIARSVVDRFPQMVEAAATLLRAADGAGLPKREPRDQDFEDDDDEDESNETVAKPAGLDLPALFAQLAPVLTMLMNKNKLDVASVIDWRKAAPDAKKLPPKSERAPRPEGPGDATASTTDAKAAATTELPPIPPEMMAHFIAIQAALKPDEAALARQVASDLTPVELHSWVQELGKLTVPQAVQKIRVLISGNTEAVS